MSKSLRRLTTVNVKTLILWTNQFRTKIGVTFGNPNTTPGGRALKYYDTARIEMRQGEGIKEPRQVASKGKLMEKPVRVGNWVQCSAQKNKASRPYLQGSFVFDHDAGEIDITSEIIQLGLEDGTIIRTGNKFSYVDIDGEEWAGMEKAFKKLLNENDDLREELIELIQDATLDLATPGGVR